MKKIIACMIVLSVLMSNVAFVNTVDFEFSLRPTDMENDFVIDEKSTGYKNDNEARFYVTQESTTYPMSSSNPIYYRAAKDKIYIEYVSNYIPMTSNSRKYASYKMDVEAYETFKLACRVKYNPFDFGTYTAEGRWTP